MEKERRTKTRTAEKECVRGKEKEREMSRGAQERWMEGARETERRDAADDMDVSWSSQGSPSVGEVTSACVAVTALGSMLPLQTAASKCTNNI